MIRYLACVGFILTLCSGCDDRKNADPDRTTAVEDSAKNAATQSSSGETTEAVCELVAIGGSQVSGTIMFKKEGNVVHVRGQVSGLSPGQHGFHVHERGDLTDRDTGKSAGDHYNPTQKDHGRHDDTERHVGDLGNIEANEEGIADIDLKDTVIQLDGEHSIVGRSLVVHEKADQFTQPAGDAGGRIAFGRIDARQPEQ